MNLIRQRLKWYRYCNYQLGIASPTYSRASIMAIPLLEKRFMDLSMKYLLDIGDVFCATIISIKHPPIFDTGSEVVIGLLCNANESYAYYRITSLHYGIIWNEMGYVNWISYIPLFLYHALLGYFFTHTATICDAHVMTCAVWIWIYGKPHIWLLKSNNCLELSLGQFIFIVILPSKLPGIWL